LCFGCAKIGLTAKNVNEANLITLQLLGTS